MSTGKQWYIENPNYNHNYYLRHKNKYKSWHELTEIEKEKKD
jgi:hypothetical protein